MDLASIDGTLEVSGCCEKSSGADDTIIAGKSHEVDEGPFQNSTVI